MHIYKYTVVKQEDGYRYSTDEIDVADDDSLFSRFKYDKPVRVDFPQHGQIVFLFDNELAFHCFEMGMSFCANKGIEFEAMTQLKEPLERRLQEEAT